ncbi:MAG: glycoside hydrolase family 20 zincin-like fold domain-containing protein, partial [Acidobacteriaceae bacterium]
MRSFFIATFVGWFCAVGLAQATSSLSARGYTVLPEPQKVSLGTHDFTFGQNWQLKLDKSVAHGDAAVEALREGINSRFHMKLGASAGTGGVLTLRIAPGSVQIGKAQDPNKTLLEEQAYRITLHSGEITITANAGAGLFYGVETFGQLLRPKSGVLWLPEGSIEDWPDLELRLILWDDSYHLDRVDALKRDIRQAAFYKINGFVLKLNGHFQYKSAPAVVEPYALSAAELRELTDYGRHFHVHLIPYLDGPGHVAFILKHPEYAKLREFPGSNYEMCATNVASYKLLHDMYQELLSATEGVNFFLGTTQAGDYFFLPADDAYFLGMAHNSQCNEADLKKQLGSAGQVYVHFVD